MRRILIGIVLGVFAAFACVFVVEAIGAALFPLPPGVDPRSAAGETRAMTALPFAAKALVVFGWCLGTVIGGGLAARLAHLRLAPWIVAGFIVAGAAKTMTEVAHPGWMVAAGLLLPWACAWGVQRLARRPRSHR